MRVGNVASAELVDSLLVVSGEDVLIPLVMVFLYFVDIVLLVAV